VQSAVLCGHVLRASTPLSDGTTTPVGEGPVVCISAVAKFAPESLKYACSKNAVSA
jgi:hypothetical protein